MGKSFIYLLFTKSNTLMSKAVSALTSDEYTHVSVCVDENLSDFYSFGRRRPCFMLPAGFTKESVYGGLYLRDESIPCKLVRIQTGEKKVDRAKAILDFFYAHRFQYKYSIIGTILCRVGITCHRDHHRFCSQFVSELLQECDIMTDGREPALTRPSQLDRELRAYRLFEGDIGGLKVWLKNRESAAASTSLMQHSGLSPSWIR